MTGQTAERSAHEYYSPDGVLVNVAGSGRQGKWQDAPVQPDWGHLLTVPGYEERALLRPALSGTHFPAFLENLLSQVAAERRCLRLHAATGRVGSDAPMPGFLRGESAPSSYPIGSIERVSITSS